MSRKANGTESTPQRHQAPRSDQSSTSFDIILLRISALKQRTGVIATAAGLKDKKQIRQALAEASATTDHGVGQIEDRLTSTHILSKAFGAPLIFSTRKVTKSQREDGNCPPPSRAPPHPPPAMAERHPCLTNMKHQPAEGIPTFASKHGPDV